LSCHFCVVSLKLSLLSCHFRAVAFKLPLSSCCWQAVVAELSFSSCRFREMSSSLLPGAGLRQIRFKIVRHQKTDSCNISRSTVGCLQCDQIGRKIFLETILQLRNLQLQ
jgi:hypothetical protein